MNDSDLYSTLAPPCEERIVEALGSFGLEVLFFS
jgi:hypothetical protein